MSQPAAASAPYVAGAHPAPENAMTQAYEAPRGVWRDGICDCFKNLWPSCCCVFLNGTGILPIFYSGQISSRVGFIKTVPVVLTYIVLIVICFIVSIAGSALKKDWSPVYLIPGVSALVFTIVLRFKVAAFYGIDENVCQTCCTGFWCFACSICQMGRHVYGYTKQFDGDGDLDGNMTYGGGNAAANV